MKWESSGKHSIDGDWIRENESNEHYVGPSEEDISQSMKDSADEINAMLGSINLTEDSEEVKDNEEIHDKEKELKEMIEDDEVEKMKNEIDDLKKSLGGIFGK